jgi:hypothetical protein
VKSRWILNFALCTLFATPAALHAQAAEATTAAASAPTQAVPGEVYNRLLGMMEKEIVGAADAMPAEKYNFAPDVKLGEFKGVRTYGSQVKHLAEANYGFFEGWGVPGGVKDADIEKLTSKDDIMKALKDSYTFAHSAMGTITAENAFVEMGSGERKSTRIGLASFCIAHSMDHYGQMVVYLRMNGIVPPASRGGM